MGVRICRRTNVKCVLKKYNMKQRRKIKNYNRVMERRKRKMRALRERKRHWNVFRISHGMDTSMFHF